MQGVLYAACGTAFTFWMTTLGAALVFFFRGHVGEHAQRACFGFAAGVMAAASVFSLLTPAVEWSGGKSLRAALVTTLGFAAGAGMILAADRAMERRERALAHGESARKRALLMTAVTLHNIPEGMAVGLAYAVAAREGGAALASATALALGVGIQNFPEGAAISLPLRRSGMSRMQSFLWGVASGAVEPAFGVLVVLAAALVRPVMPLLMAFAAGAMMWVVVSEMIPDAAQDRRGALCVIVGFGMMMALDVALG